MVFLKSSKDELLYLYECMYNEMHSLEIPGLTFILRLKLKGMSGFIPISAGVCIEAYYPSGKNMTG